MRLNSSIEAASCAWNVPESALKERLATVAPKLWVVSRVELPPSTLPSSFHAAHCSVSELKA